MAEVTRPSNDPMNGPNRLFLERTAEVRKYDTTDWPGSGSFHPNHLDQFFRDMSEASVESVTEVAQPELPFESTE